MTVDAGRDPITGRRRQVHRTWRGPNTKRGRQAAETELAKFVAEVEAGRAAPSSGITVAQLIERYVADRSPGWSPGSADAVRRRVAQHVVPHIGATAIEKLRPVDITTWHGNLRDAGLSEATIGRVHGIVQAALAWAVDLDLIPRNVAARRKPRAARRDVTPPAPADVARMLDEADDDLSLFLRIAALTGARRGQLCALQWGDVDLDAGTIRWQRSLAKVPGGVVAKSTKTGARYTTAIDPVTVDALRRHRTRAGERALSVGATVAPDAYVFARDAVGEQPWHPDGASQRFAKLRKRLGMDGVRLHDLRHYMATQLLAEGFDVRTLAGRGGWANASMPLAVYAHFQPARDVDAARRLAERLDVDGGSERVSR